MLVKTLRYIFPLYFLAFTPQSLPFLNFLLFWLKTLAFGVTLKLFLGLHAGLCFAGWPPFKNTPLACFQSSATFPVIPLSIINKLRNLTSAISRGTSLMSSFLDAPVLSIKFRRGKLLSSFVPGSWPPKCREDFRRTTWLFLLFHTEKEHGTRVLVSGRLGLNFVSATSSVTFIDCAHLGKVEDPDV